MMNIRPEIYREIMAFQTGAIQSELIILGHTLSPKYAINLQNFCIPAK
jgi:hypothetical protein